LQIYNKKEYYDTLIIDLEAIDVISHIPTIPQTISVSLSFSKKYQL